MGFTIGYLLFQWYFISALLFFGVYVFRYFHRDGQKVFHYGFAGAGFSSIAFISGIYWPILLGLVVYIINKRKKTNKEVFWFEMAAGIPYLFII